MCAALYYVKLNMGAAYNIWANFRQDCIYNYYNIDFIFSKCTSNILPSSHIKDMVCYGFGLPTSLNSLPYDPYL